MERGGDGGGKTAITSAWERYDLLATFSGRSISVISYVAFAITICPFGDKGLLDSWDKGFRVTAL